MKKLILILLVGSLIADGTQTSEVINITKKSKVEVYTALFWAPCREAKALLQSRGIDFDAIMVTFSRKKVTEMAKRTGGKTSVPQIFVDDKYIGGYTELVEYLKNNALWLSHWND